MPVTPLFYYHKGIDLSLEHENTFIIEKCKIESETTKTESFSLISFPLHNSTDRGGYQRK